MVQFTRSSHTELSFLPDLLTVSTDAKEIKGLKSRRNLATHKENLDRLQTSEQAVMTETSPGGP